MYKSYYSLTFTFLAGDISCEFVGTSVGERIESVRNVSLAVLPPPTVKISPLTITVLEDNWFTLTCEAHVPNTGHPDVWKGLNITWFEIGGRSREPRRVETGPRELIYYE